MFAGAKIGYCSQLLSSEEAPNNERTLRKQRLRWAQGWFEVSIKHLWSLMTSSYTSWRQRVGFFTLLGFREFFVYLTFHPPILVGAYLLRNPESPIAAELLLIIAGGLPLITLSALESTALPCARKSTKRIALVLRRLMPNACLQFFGACLIGTHMLTQHCAVLPLPISGT